jgi:hypothetical protein
MVHTEDVAAAAKQQADDTVQSLRTYLNNVQAEMNLLNVNFNKVAVEFHKDDQTKIKATQEEMRCVPARRCLAARCHFYDALARSNITAELKAATDTLDKSTTVIKGNLSQECAAIRRAMR